MDFCYCFLYIFCFFFCSLLNNYKFNRDRRNPTFTTTRSDNKCRAGDLRIDGMRVESADKSIEFDDDNVPDLITRTNARLRLFGCGFTEQTVITLTKQVNDRDGACLLPASGQFKVLTRDLYETTALVDIVVPAADLTPYFFCVKNAEDVITEKVRSHLYLLDK